MPELPEVETTRRGLEPLLLGRHVVAATVRSPRLRYPLPSDLGARLAGQRFLQVQRRAKYLLLHLDKGILLVHLGMSGSLRLAAAGSAVGRHDHVDIELDNSHLLRLTDPRRFGMLLWLSGDALEHPLLRSLGPEPLGDDFDGDWLHACSRGRKSSVKQLIMQAEVVVGVGNIYAAEALFAAGIHPARPAGRVSVQRYRRLAEAIRQVLRRSIEQGGTTLRDFAGGDGKPGYFRQQLVVYGRQRLPCRNCGTPLHGRRIAQRSTVFCPRCQR